VDLRQLHSRNGKERSGAREWGTEMREREGRIDRVGRPPCCEILY